jgi:hypothetical protein
MEATSAKTEVSWPEPQFSCTTGGDASIEKTEVVPAWSSPRNFYPGNYVITYTYTLNGGVTVACPVNINIAGKHTHEKYNFNITTSTSSKSSTHYLSDTIRFKLQYES